MSALPRYDDALPLVTDLRRTPVGLRSWEIGIVLALVSGALALRVANLGALPLFFDEGEYTRAAQVMGTGLSPATWLISLHYGAPPLFPWLAAPFTRFLADPLLAARLASALIGAVGLLGVWATARLLWGRAVAPVAASLYALCPFVLFYNRLAMLDGLVATCGAGALFFAVQLSRHGRDRDAWGLGLCLAAGMLTKIFALSMLLLPLLAVVAAWPRQRRTVRRKALLAALLGLLPLLGLLLAPQGRGLLSATHNHAHTTLGALATSAHQLATFGAALWLYLTPPILLLALYGLWSIRRERGALLLGPWALLGGLPPALVPGAFLAPRYFLYIAVPLVLLAARGLVMLVVALHARLSRRRLAWLVALLGSTLAITPAAASDAAIIGAPARTPLIPFDRWQYVTGWPSGYALMRAVAYLRRAEARGGGGPITVVSSIYNPPGDALTVLLGRERGILLRNVDFDTLRAHPLHATRGQQVYVIACQPYGQPLHPDRRALRLVWHTANADGAGGIDVYRVVTP